MSSSFSHVSVTGLDRERLLAVVLPVLSAHGVEGVELLWKTDRGRRVLEVTIEARDVNAPDGGVTLDMCSEVSRDLSAALDAADIIPTRYSLLVGSPGLERALYTREDYQRFQGKRARLKLNAGPDEERVLYGEILGLDPEGRISILSARGARTINLEDIQAARLVFEWSKKPGPKKGQKNSQNGIKPPYEERG